MSLSRSEEMHRLTENVYKVSPAPLALSGPTWRPRALKGLSDAAAGPGAGRSQVCAGAPASPVRAAPRCPPTLSARPGRSGEGRGPGAAAAGDDRGRPGSGGCGARGR